MRVKKRWRGLHHHRLKELDDEDPRGIALAVQLWNQHVPVGGQVDYMVFRPYGHSSYESSVTRSQAFVLAGKAMIRIKGIMGPISLDRVKPLDYGALQVFDRIRLELWRRA
jgi:hypothetical protein